MFGSPRACLPLALLMGVAACAEREPPPQGSPVATRPSPSSAAAPEAPPGAAQGEALPEPSGRATAGQTAHAAIEQAEARALLERWVEAQNARELERYAELYLDRFVGVKRSGSRTRRFDRSGWLDDRKAMFERPMKVEVEDVRIQTTASAAVISFRQIWASKTYADKGPKRIVALPTPAGLRIASEEMLASEVVRHDAHGTLPPEKLMFVMQTDRGPIVVLTDQGDDAWAQGAPVLERDEGVVTTTRTVRADALPEGLRALAGLAVQLLSADGIACRGVLGTPRLMRRVIPHFGTRHYWNGDDDGDGTSERPPLASEAIAAEAWQLEARPALLVAPLDDATGDCRAAIWARSAALPQARIFTGTPATDEVAAAVTHEVHALPAYKSIQREFRRADESDGRGRWELYEPTILTFRDGERTYHSYHATTGEGCGEFEGHLWALFEVVGGELRLLTGPRRPDHWTPLAIVDADGDGLIEVISAPRRDDPTPTLLLRQRPDQGFESSQYIAPSNLDADC